MNTSTAPRTAATVPAPRSTEAADGMPAEGAALRLTPAGEQTLLAELRASGMLFFLALLVTVGVAAACQAASALLA